VIGTDQNITTTMLSWCRTSTKNQHSHWVTSKQSLHNTRVRAVNCGERNLKLDAPSCNILHVALPSSSQQRSLISEALAANKRALDFLDNLALL